MRRIVVLACLALSVGLAQELLVNGGFEQDLSTGWTQASNGGTPFFDRSADYEPDPDYEAQAYLYSGSGWLRLSQMVAAPHTVLDLSFRASFQLGGGSSSCWPVGAFSVGYYDAGNTLLGETRFYYHNSYCDWVAGPTLSLHNVDNPGWMLYTLNLADELSEHLPGVDPDAVARVQVGPYAYTSGG